VAIAMITSSHSHFILQYVSTQIGQELFALQKQTPEAFYLFSSTFVSPTVNNVAQQPHSFVTLATVKYHREILHGKFKN
jgi:hypothetical protein